VTTAQPAVSQFCSGSAPRWRSDPTAENSAVGQTEMASLHDSLLTGYSVDGSAKVLVLHTEPHRGDGGAFDIRFAGVVAYRFEGDCLQNIVSDIVEVSTEAVVGDGGTLAELHRQYGWPPGWDPAREDFVQFLRRQGCRCFELNCSYGMGGWVAAESMKVVARDLT
jgi:hypothetical protein